MEINNHQSNSLSIYLFKGKYKIEYGLFGGAVVKNSHHHFSIFPQFLQVFHFIFSYYSWTHTELWVFLLTPPRAHPGLIHSNVFFSTYFIFYFLLFVELNNDFVRTKTTKEEKRMTNAVRKFLSFLLYLMIFHQTMQGEWKTNHSSASSLLCETERKFVVLLLCNSYSMAAPASWYKLFLLLARAILRLI